MTAIKARIGKAGWAEKCRHEKPSKLMSFTFYDEWLSSSCVRMPLLPRSHLRQRTTQNWWGIIADNWKMTAVSIIIKNIDECFLMCDMCYDQQMRNWWNKKEYRIIYPDTGKVTEKALYRLIKLSWGVRSSERRLVFVNFKETSLNSRGCLQFTSHVDWAQSRSRSFIALGGKTILHSRNRKIPLRNPFSSNTINFYKYWMLKTRESLQKATFLGS